MESHILVIFLVIVYVFLILILYLIFMSGLTLLIP